MEPSPSIVVLAGPNGAGKSTVAAHMLPEGMEFVNADEIARRLPGYPSKAVDIQAGRLVLGLLDELERKRADFAVETTLASRTLVRRIARLRRSGYRFRLIYLFVPNADLSVQRVTRRVLLGGHHIPEETIRRRYDSGINNFFGLYQPLADKWGVYDTTPLGPPRLIAEGTMGQEAQIHDPEPWGELRGRVTND